MTASPVTLLVQLFLHPGRRADFEAYEARAVVAMARYGGRIARRLGGMAAEGVPDEIHVVTFPDRAAFDRYRADPDVNALSEMRALAIRRTVIWDVDDLPPFAAAVA